MPRDTPLPGEQGHPSYGRTCPVCGGRYESTLPNHFRKDCPETGAGA